MTRLRKIPVVAALSAAIVAFATAGEALADRGDHRGRDSHHGRHYRGDHDRGHNYRHHRRHHVERHRDRHHRYHARRHHDRWDRHRYREARRYHSRHRYDHYRHYRDRQYYYRHRNYYSSWRPYHGPVWNGYRSAYWRDRGCHPVTRYWQWHGRPALVGGIQCYGPRGASFVVSDNYFLLNYY
jgi:hypothetical protein